MIYQQEIKEVNDFYDRYKDSKIVYSQSVVQDIGLVQRDTVIKFGDQVIKSVLISSTMEDFVFMSAISDSLKEAIYEFGGYLKIQLKFIDPETSKSILFTLDTKFLNFNTQGLTRKDLVFIAMKIRRKIPNDLIRLFGLFHTDQEQKLRDKKKKVECLLLTNDRKTDCLTEKISKTELVLRVEEEENISPNQKVLAILKVVRTGEVIEIIGSISSRSREPDGSQSLTVSYAIDDQSPRFGYSIHVLKNLINT
ncbi:MAG: hypothetical protein JXR86_20365 [Spirochaetales bacterium]|nr:hypothetical protein [Spirochaetales bacterium]